MRVLFCLIIIISIAHSGSAKVINLWSAGNNDAGKREPCVKILDRAYDQMPMEDRVKSGESGTESGKNQEKVEYLQILSGISSCIKRFLLYTIEAELKNI